MHFFSFWDILKIAQKEAYLSSKYFDQRIPWKIIGDLVFIFTYIRPFWFLVAGEKYALIRCGLLELHISGLNWVKHNFRCDTRTFVLIKISSDVLIKTYIFAFVIRPRPRFVLVIRLQDAFKTSPKRLYRYHQVKLFFLTCLRGVSNMFLRRTAKMDLPRSNFWENSTKFARVTKVYRVLIFHFTTLFSGLFQRRIKKLVEHLQWSFFTKTLNGFKLLTIFAKKAPSQILNWVENSP